MGLPTFLSLETQYNAISTTGTKFMHNGSEIIKMISKSGLVFGNWGSRAVPLVPEKYCYY
jgi:hypothetical protein